MKNKKSSCCCSHHCSHRLKLPLNDVNLDSDMSSLDDEDFLLGNLDNVDLDADLVRNDGEGEQARDNDDN